ncbi:MarR family winged helix-turn-helix transcriptional regulator [Streptomyces sp. JJ36]|uniref:MarR family winged helix-turn-helix transcriptional regulator n=1 Tax=Streptomyces sp. JJ36 TaxID=2736645 RepID=UPI001F1D7CE9|nr:MarR family transcriptional regulator [Streptomyces sp. JJ36]MCF6524759.1 MarR family transcriptional regulator [Streptomyces sp. JJ36]
MATSPAPPTGGPADPLTREVVDLIGTVVARYHEEYELAAAEHALTGAQARVLALLAREPMPMRKVAVRLKCEPSNVTGIVDRLEARGLVERRPDPADRRVKLAAATASGRSTAEGLRGSLDFAREPLAGLTSLERRLLRDLLRRMLGESTAGGSAPDAGTPDGSAPGEPPGDAAHRGAG